MNNVAFWVIVVPFALSGIAYVGAAVGYHFFFARPWMGVAMLCYTGSCAALVLDALTVGAK